MRELFGILNKTIGNTCCVHLSCLFFRFCQTLSPLSQKSTSPLSLFPINNHRVSRSFVREMWSQQKDSILTCTPRAVLPIANCAVFVLSRQSTQLVRTTPCCRWPNITPLYLTHAIIIFLSIRLILDIKIEMIIRIAHLFLNFRFKKITNMKANDLDFSRS